MRSVPGTLGLIANPAAGRDVRRLVANATTTSLVEKITRLRRVLVGAAEAGVDRVLAQPDPSRICRRALDPLHLDLEVADVVIPHRYDESDTVAAAMAMRTGGAGAVVVLGGDGTSRAACLGWPDAPLLALSTGTNNVFPVAIEATVAGMAAGLVATGRVAVADAAQRAKVVHLALPGGTSDIALVDVALLDEGSVGSLAPAAPGAIRALVLARAEPASVGMSAIGGLLRRCTVEDDGALVVRLGPGGAPLRAPVSPGLYQTVGVSGCEPAALGEEVVLDGPGVLALDGDRRHLLRAGERAVATVERDGPWVIEASRAVEAGYRTAYTS